MVCFQYFYLVSNYAHTHFICSMAADFIDVDTEFFKHLLTPDMMMLMYHLSLTTVWRGSVIISISHVCGRTSGSINIQHRECQGREAAGIGEVRQRQTEVRSEVKESE